MADSNEKRESTELTNKEEVEHVSNRSDSTAGDAQILRDEDEADRRRKELNRKLNNPLSGHSLEKLKTMGEDYARQYSLGDEDDIRAFGIGAMLAQNPEAPDLVSGCTPEEMAILTQEVEHRWSQPRLLYLVIILCSTCAAVQGMDETVVNGAQIFYSTQFGIGGKDSRSTWLLGLTNSAPYLCCAFVGCWLTIPFNNWFGRRGTVFLTCMFSALACFWQAFTSRFIHGLLICCY
jgi:hypothetical protein